MAERQPATCMLLLDNMRLASFSGASVAAAEAADSGGGAAATRAVSAGGAPLELLLRDAQGAGVKGGAWRRVQQQGGGSGDGAAAGLVVEGGGWEGVRKRYLNMFAAGRHRELVDYEEHLDDLGRDFLNPGLLAGSELLAR